MKVIYLGKEVELEDGIIGFNAVKALDPERRKEALAFKVGERIYDMNQVVPEGELSFVFPSDKEGFEMMNEIIEKIDSALQENHVYADVYDWITDSGEKVVKIEIHWGDWKHDHLRAQWIVEDVLGIGVRKWDTDVTEEDGSDCYSAIHTVWLGEKPNYEIPVLEVIE